MDFLNVKQIKKYHEANTFVEVLEEKPVIFKDYLARATGFNRKAMKEVLVNFEHKWMDSESKVLLEPENETKLSGIIESGHNRFLQLRNINNKGNEFLDLEILVSSADAKEI